jgi:hypothetical protein
MANIGEHVMTRATLLLSCLCLFIVAGCTTRVGDFTAISSKNIFCKNVDVTKLPQKRVEGKDIRLWGMGANYKDALDKALEEGNGNLMIDAVCYIETWPIPIFNFAGYKLVGTVVNVPYQQQ